MKPRCWTCRTTDEVNKCFVKFAIYEIKCLQCDKLYIRQTVRTIKSRIREHVTVPSSAFFQHVINSHQVMPEDCCKWKILATETDNAARLALEALFIRRRSDFLVNGCDGQSLLPFLDNVTSSSSETHALPY